MNNIQEIYALFAKKNNLPKEADQSRMETVVEILSAHGVDHDYFYTCENCGFKNPNRDITHLSEAEIAAELTGTYYCKNCNQPIF
jgi:predicted RNA-binding Zn-ribbon protein involved in translation (DUF1610 family)